MPYKIPKNRTTTLGTIYTGAKIANNGKTEQ